MSSFPLQIVFSEMGKTSIRFIPSSRQNGEEKRIVMREIVALRDSFSVRRFSPPSSKNRHPRW